MPRQTKDFDEMVADTGVSCLMNTILFLTSFGFSALAGLIGALFKQPPIERQLVTNKSPVANGTAIVAVLCPQCSTKNEEGQIACYACGYALHVPTTIKSQLLSDLQIQWLTWSILLIIGLLLANSRSGNGTCIGGIILLASIGWGLALLISTVAKLGRR